MVGNFIMIKKRYLLIILLTLYTTSTATLLETANNLDTEITLYLTRSVVPGEIFGATEDSIFIEPPTTVRPQETHSYNVPFARLQLYYVYSSQPFRINIYNGQTLIRSYITPHDTAALGEIGITKARKGLSFKPPFNALIEVPSHQGYKIMVCPITDTKCARVG
jgi:hypothetical protein